MNICSWPLAVRRLLAWAALAALWAVWLARLAVALPVCVWIVALQVVGMTIVAAGALVGRAVGRVVLWVLDIATAVLDVAPARVQVARLARRIPLRFRIDHGVLA